MSSYVFHFYENFPFYGNTSQMAQAWFAEIEFLIDAFHFHNFPRMEHVEAF